MISSSQARIYNFFKDVNHLTHSSGYFFPKNKFADLKGELIKKNILTSFLTIHPLCKLSDDYRKNLIISKKKVFWLNLKNEIKVSSFSKSIKDKIRKHSNIKINKSSFSEFYKIFKIQSFFNKYKKLTLDFNNCKIYRAINGEDISFSVFGFNKDISEYLLACSSKNGHYLQSAIIYFFVKKYYGKTKYLNLGGGIYPGDGIEKFKSLFKGDFTFQKNLKIVTDKKKFITLKNSKKEILFFPPYATKDTIEKLF